MPSLFAIGDVHGQRVMLDLLLERVPIEADDEVVFIGDFIDRGPDSRGVVEAVLAFRLSHPRTVCLRGNHEDMFLDYIDQGGRYENGVFMMNGGYDTLQSYAIDPREGPPRLPPLHREFFDELLYYHETDGFVFVHAGLRPGVPLEEQTHHDMLWIRHDFFDSDIDIGKPIVFGHTPMQEVLDGLPRFLGIDTGAAYGNKLTCVRLSEGEVRETYEVRAGEAAP